MLLGNDVVDRKETSARDKHLDGRFLGRCFTSEEAHCVRFAADPSLAVWMIWAIKESVFKVMRKLDPELVFSHRDFAVSEQVLELLADATEKEGRLSTQLLQKDSEFALILSWNEDFVHCLAGWRRRGVLHAAELEALTAVRVETVAEMPGTLSARELDSVHSEESRQVRLLAKKLLNEHHELHQPELVRERIASRLLPPEVLEEGRPAPGIDLSLSHDGRFVAAAITAHFDASA